VGSDAASAYIPLMAGRALVGRRALITGGASGIGRACAVRLAEDGADVVVVDRDAEAAEAVARQVGGTAVAVDLSDLDAVDALDLAVDVLVNNAGLQHVAPLHEFPVDRFSYILRLMLEAPFRLVRGALPHMYEQQWGRIVNVSSVHGLRASPFKSAYVTAKHGLEGLSKVIALEGAEHGVTSNCVNPAYVRTPLVEGQIADQARTHGLSEDEVVEQVMLAPAAIKRLIEPAEVADAVSWLCSPAAGSVTGTSLVMDGGWSAH
jgi:3-hydroxybutyrate dehydrogenase